MRTETVSYLGRPTTVVDEIQTREKAGWGVRQIVVITHPLQVMIVVYEMENQGWEGMIPIGGTD